jgi:hypothetical protein
MTAYNIQSEIGLLTKSLQILERGGIQVAKKKKAKKRKR